MVGRDGRGGASEATFAPLELAIRAYDVFVRCWQQLKSFIEKFTSNDECKSKSARLAREELARVRPDNIHPELVLLLGFTVAVDVGIHLTRATHLLEGDGFLVCTSAVWLRGTLKFACHVI